ncbi:MAG: hypothetical protein ACI8Y4_001995 [Candidatus Poriferisodalaceae bacterium]|jgi:hypothetical protein
MGIRRRGRPRVATARKVSRSSYVRFQLSQCSADRSSTLVLVRRSLLALAVAVTLSGCGTNPGPATSAAHTPTLTPGGLSVGSVRVAAHSPAALVQYVAIVPSEFQIGDTAPVLLVLPPSSQSLTDTETYAARTLTSEATSRGWVVISPVAPDAQFFFEGSEQFLPGVVGWIQTWVEPEGELVHLAGVSNGGVSAFRVAGQHPDLFGSITVLPRYPSSPEDVAVLSTLAEIPIRMFVGGDDGSWANSVPMSNWWSLSAKATTWSRSAMDSGFLRNWTLCGDFWSVK